MGAGVVVLVVDGALVALFPEVVVGQALSAHKPFLFSLASRSAWINSVWYL